MNKPKTKLYKRVRIRVFMLAGIGLLAGMMSLPPTSAQGPTPRGDVKPAKNETIDHRDDELARRLIEGESAGSDDVMQRMLELMSASEQRLKRQFDPGPLTQQLQNDVMLCIDSAIEAALRQRRTETSPLTQRGDRRTMPETRKPKQTAPQPATTGKQADRSRPGSVSGQPDDQPVDAGPFRESRRSWGHLPQRDRDEIIQGSTEPALEKYRDLIDAYFRSLAEPKGPQP